VAKYKCPENPPGSGNFKCNLPEEPSSPPDHGGHAVGIGDGVINDTTRSVIRNAHGVLMKNPLVAAMTGLVEDEYGYNQRDLNRSLLEKTNKARALSASPEAMSKNALATYATDAGSPPFVAIFRDNVAHTDFIKGNPGFSDMADLESGLNGEAAFSFLHPGVGDVPAGGVAQVVVPYKGAKFIAIDDLMTLTKDALKELADPLKVASAARGSWDEKADIDPETDPLVREIAATAHKVSTVIASDPTAFALLKGYDAVYRPDGKLIILNPGAFKIADERLSPVLAKTLSKYWNERNFFEDVINKALMEEYITEDTKTELYQVSNRLMEWQSELTFAVGGFTQFKFDINGEINKIEEIPTSPAGTGTAPSEPGFKKKKVKVPETTHLGPVDPNVKVRGYSTDPKDLEPFVDASATMLANNPTHHNSVYEYTSNDAYRLVNKSLGGVSLDGYESEIAKRHIRGLDAVMADAPKLDRAAVMWRGTSHNEQSRWLKQSVDGSWESLVGKEILCPTFQSFSRGEGTAHEFVKGHGGFIIELLAPKGTRALAVDEATRYNTEAEVLLDRGTKIRIKEVKKNVYPGSGDIVKVVAKVVGQRKVTKGGKAKGSEEARAG